MNDSRLPRPRPPAAAASCRSSLAVAYLVVQARRRRYALRFTTLDLLDEVAPDRPGWRRHLPAIVLLLGIVAAALAVAKPAVAKETREPQRIVVLAIDTSLSMQATDVSPSRVDAAKASAAEFLKTVPDGVAVGVVGFDSRARQLIAPTTNLDAVQRTIERAKLGQGTAIGEAVFLALDAIETACDPARDRRRGRRASGAPPPARSCCCPTVRPPTAGRTTRPPPRRRSRASP